VKVFIVNARDFHIEPKPAQQIWPAAPDQRFEGLDYSSSGKLLAAATSDTNDVQIFRRGFNGKFNERPVSVLQGLKYPHDVSFGRFGRQELLAVAQRAGAIAIFRLDDSGEAIDQTPVFEINGPESKLEFSDGVAFLAPRINCLAACNLTSNTISFFPLLSRSPLRFALQPEFEIKHASIQEPDGLSFSARGKWMAIANHGGGTISIFR
jgi:hypothetical protein